jgi:hypothetical protein
LDARLKHNLPDGALHLRHRSGDIAVPVVAAAAQAALAEDD